jgi:hypothetical protein
MLAAVGAVFPVLHPVRVFPLVLGISIIATLALVAG